MATFEDDPHVGGQHDDMVDSIRYVQSALPQKLSLRSRILGYLGLAGYFIGLSPWLYLYGRALWTGLHDPDVSVISIPIFILSTTFIVLVASILEMLAGRRNGITSAKVFLVMNALLMLMGTCLTAFDSTADFFIIVLFMFLFSLTQTILSWLYFAKSGTVKRIYGV